MVDSPPTRRAPSVPPWFLGGVSIFGIAFVVMARQTESPRPVEPFEPLEVAFAGCDEVHRGPVCTIAKTATITLWLESKDAPPAPQIDGQRSTVSFRPFDGGWQWRSTVTSNATSMAISDSQGRTQWRMPVSRLGVDPRIDAINQLRKKGEFAKALAATAPIRDASDPWVRARVRGLEGRLQHDLGEDGWRALLEESRALNETNGNLSGVNADVSALSYNFREAGRYGEARKALDHLSTLFASMPESRAGYGYYGALVALQSGDIGLALSRLESARTWSARLGDTYLLQATMIPQIQLLLTLGRDAEAIELVRVVSESARSAGPCALAATLNSLSWFRASLGADMLPAAIDEASEAVALYKDKCPKPAGLANALVNLATARLGASDLDGATEALDRADAVAEMSMLTGIGIGIARSEVALRRGQLERALTGFRAIENRTSTSLFPERHLEAVLGEASVLAALGREPEALSAYERADAVVDQLVALIPLYDGPGGLVRRFTRASNARIELLLGMGRTAAAADVARRSIRRRSAILEVTGRISALVGEERNAWDVAVRTYQEDRSELIAEAQRAWEDDVQSSTQSKEIRGRRAAQIQRSLDRLMTLIGVRAGAERLAANRSDELLVVMHPAESITHVFWGADAHFEHVAVSGALLGNPAAAKFMADLDSAQRVRIVTAPYLPGVRLDALFADRRTGKSPKVVTFALDLPTVDVPPATPDAVLIVSDPDGTLPRARIEADRLAKRLRSLNRNVTELAGAAATFDAVQRELSSGRYALFHFAGHAEVLGPGGWRSHLRLAEGARLEVGDVLALSSVPRLIVLAACEAAGRGADEEWLGIGVAQAFLMRGAQVAVAPNRRVGDDESELAVRRLYEELEHFFDRGPAEQLARAQRVQSPGDEPASIGYRAYVR